MSVVSQRPRRQYEVLHWGHVDLQEYANGRFVSNNNIFIIVFFNTYYHKQINKILISACNETFRQSSDPVYAHTPMRNVGGLRTFNPKLKDSAGGEVNKICGYTHLISAVLMHRIKSWFNTSMTWCKAAVTPMRQECNYCCLALNHRFPIYI